MAFVTPTAPVVRCSGESLLGAWSKRLPNICTQYQRIQQERRRKCSRLGMAVSPSQTQQPPRERRAILLVDHGSRREDSNNMLNNVRELLTERLGPTSTVHIAHMELASPTIHEGFTRCVADGATHIVVVPFFLGPGRHVTEDIPKLSTAAASSFPGLTHEVSPHLGDHPLLVDVILDRGGLVESETKEK